MERKTIKEVYLAWREMKVSLVRNRRLPLM